MSPLRLMNAMTKSSKTTPPKDFESALHELEGLVATLEAGQLPLEASLQAYQRGVKLTRFCQQFLGDAEQKLRILENSTLQPLSLDARDA